MPDQQELADDMTNASPDPEPKDLKAISPHVESSQEEWLAALRTIADPSGQRSFGSEVFEPAVMDVQRRNEIPSPYFKASIGDLPLEYNPLDDPEHQIRLLGRSDNDQWKLSTWCLKSAPPYAALSYVWGAADGTREMVQIDGSALPVTPNCALALRQLWLRGEFDYFWIDAICINQADNVEKGHQVQAMAEIYINASTTYISLGSHDMSSLRLFTALGALEHKASPRCLVCLLSSDAFKMLVQALNMVGRRDYWQRLWIYQEVILSRELTILCGPDVVAWDFLGRLLQHLEDRRISRRHSSEFTRSDGHNDVSGYRCVHSHEDLDPTFRSAPKPFGYQTLQDIYMQRSIWAYTKDYMQRSSWWSDTFLMNIYQLIEFTHERKCLVMHDRVFAVMYLLRRPPAVAAIDVDYNKSLFEIAIDILRNYPSKFVPVVDVVALTTCLQLGPDDVDSCEQRIAASSAHAVTTVAFCDLSSTQLRLNKDGVLACKFAPAKAIDTTDLGAWTDLPPDIEDTFRPLIDLDGLKIGIVSIQCKPDDILLELEAGMQLVVRANSDRDFKIVGHAVLRANLRTSEESQKFDKGWYKAEIQNHDLLA